MTVSETEHLADIIIYWRLPPSDEYKVGLLEGNRKPPCDSNRPDWDSILEQWKDRQLACLWLCERHAEECGFIWRTDGC
jgi:hypothetical protein